MGFLSILGIVVKVALAIGVVGLGLSAVFFLVIRPAALAWISPVTSRAKFWIERLVPVGMLAIYGRVAWILYNYFGTAMIALDKLTK
jgi:hypothetical protein